MKHLFYISFFIFFVSCTQKNPQEVAVQETKPLLSLVKKHAAIQQVKPAFKKEIEAWEELHAVHSFLGRFKNTSPNEALSNALELRDLVKSLKNSVLPETYNLASFKARINILNNEALRLADLTDIPAITAEEVNRQVIKTRTAFSSLNDKINTIISKKRFEDAIDVNFEFIGIDSTKMDSVSRKTISKQRGKEQLSKKNKPGLKKLTFKNIPKKLKRKN